MSVTVKGEKREAFGKNACRRLRLEGKIPAVLYGEEISNTPLSVFKKDIIDVLKSDTGENTLLQVTYNGERRDVMIKDIQLNPVTDELLHVDLIQIVLDKTIQVSVPVITVGEAVGVKTEGGFIDYVTRELEIECLPQDIPESIEIDISSLHIHQSFKVGDCAPLEGVEIVTDKETVLVIVAVPTKEEEVVEEVVEEELMAEEEGPEVIRKEKEEAEEEKEKEKK